MPTPNFNFTTINGTDQIDIVTALNTPLGQIDAALKTLSDRIDEISGNNYTTGTTYDQLKSHGFIYNDIQS